MVAEAGDGLFVTSKVWRAHHGHAATTRCLNQSLRRLGLGAGEGRRPLDLCLVHWPGPGYSAMGRSKAKIEAEGIQCCKRAPLLAPHAYWVTQ